MQSHLTDEEPSLSEHDATVRAAIGSGSDEATAIRLKQKLTSKNLTAPVFVLYLDSAKTVQGYCLGPKCTSYTLNQIAKDLFGVEVGSAVPVK
jgi:hypothetical protein